MQNLNIAITTGKGNCGASKKKKNLNHLSVSREGFGTLIEMDFKMNLCVSVSPKCLVFCIYASLDVMYAVMGPVYFK